jgi:myo-inositol-1(or 4)-monophosphatase
MQKTLTQLEKIAWRAVEAGEKTALKFFDYRTVNGYSYKPHHETVTSADFATNNEIIRVLKKFTPDIPILSEEGADLEETEAGEPPLAWALDPIDGTTNFIGRIPLWGISLALLEYGEPLIGAIALPSLKQKYSAVRGQGARMDKTHLHVSKTKPLKESLALMCYGYRTKDALQGASIISAFKTKVRAERVLGAAVIEASWVAAGRADFAVLQGAHVWDVAAGALLVREAGGAAVNFQGHAWTWQEKNIIFSNPQLLPIILKTINHD